MELLEMHVSPEEVEVECHEAEDYRASLKMSIFLG